MVHYNGNFTNIDEISMFIQGERWVHESLGKGEEVIFGIRGHIHESWWYVGVTVKLGLLFNVLQ